MLGQLREKKYFTPSFYWLKKIQICFFCKNSKDSSVPFMIFFATIFFSHRIPELSNVLLVSNYMKASSSRHAVFLSW